MISPKHFEAASQNLLASHPLLSDRVHGLNAGEVDTRAAGGGSNLSPSTLTR